MGQNLAAQTFRNSAGQLTFPQLDAAGNLRTVPGGSPNHPTVAASQTKAVLGATGAVGDVLSSLLIIPATTSPGAVTLYDGSGGTGIVLFTGGATSVADLKPISIPLNIAASTVATPGWFVTTGAAVSVLAVGKFT